MSTLEPLQVPESIDLDGKANTEDLESYHRSYGIQRPLIKQLAKIDPPNISDVELIKRVRRGDQSGNFLLLCKHYKYILAKVIEATNGTYFSEDVLQAGIMGLYEAAKRFDLRYKNKFLTYAHSWILKYVYIEMRNEVLPLGGLKVGRDTKERLYNYVKYKLQGYDDEYIKAKLKIKDATLNDLKMLNAMASRMKSLDKPPESGTASDTAEVTYVPATDEQSPEALATSNAFTAFLEEEVRDIAKYSQKAYIFVNYELGLNGFPLTEKHELCKILKISSKDYDNIKQICHTYL